MPVTSAILVDESSILSQYCAMKVLLPDSFTFDLPLLHSLTTASDIEYQRYSGSCTDFSKHSDAEMLILAMNTDACAQASVTQLPNLKLVQTLAAGPDHLFALGYNERISLASGRGLHDITVTEHALALTLALVRNLDALHRAQLLHDWNQDYIHGQATSQTELLYTLNKAKVLIYGFGSIAANLAPILTTLGAQVTGVAQSSGSRHGFPVISVSESKGALQDADIVISLLPYTEASDKFFNKDFFNTMKESALFINVGRGKTVDEGSLIDALTHGKIRAAAIDVTAVEPLPKESPLWTTPNLTITPHVAGGRPRNSEELIAYNASALSSGSQIRNLVSRS